jgi:hypothetical protein
MRADCLHQLERPDDPCRVVGRRGRSGRLGRRWACLRAAELAFERRSRKTSKLRFTSQQFLEPCGAGHRLLHSEHGPILGIVTARHGLTRRIPTSAVDLSGSQLLQELDHHVPRLDP